MKKIDLNNKKIRLFFHDDLDGTISASIIQHYSGAIIVKYIPCSSQNIKKPEKKLNVLDVFVDCRSRDKDENIRIDHHNSGEDNKYLKKDGIIVKTSYKSAVSLVVEVLNLNINKDIIKEMDKADSGKENIFSKFKFDKNTIYKILFNPGLKKNDFQNYENFKDKLLNFMIEGFAIEKIKDTPNKYEQKLERKYKIKIEDIKKQNKNLIKLIHNKTTQGFIFEQIFTIKDSDFYNHILPFIKQHYYEESKKNNIGIYVIIAFKARNHRYDKNCKKITKDNHFEPYQIFISRSEKNTNINIGDLINKVKEKTGITNGGGRNDVGGLNTNDKNKAIHALKLLVKYIKIYCP
jgi:hypothetical protein